MHEELQRFLQDPDEMLSNTCKYGIRALTYIASRQSGKKMIGIKQISEDLKMPLPFLAKILQQLAKNKILNSTKGPHGGFSFKKDPAKVTLYDIILIIDGDSFFENCVIHNRNCRSAGEENLLCPIHDEFSVIRDSITTLFKSKTIYDLVVSAEESDEVML